MNRFKHTQRFDRRSLASGGGAGLDMAQESADGAYRASHNDRQAEDSL